MRTRKPPKTRTGVLQRLESIADPLADAERVVDRLRAERLDAWDAGDQLEGDERVTHREMAAASRVTEVTVGNTLRRHRDKLARLAKS